MAVATCRVYHLSVTLAMADVSELFANCELNFYGQLAEFTNRD